MASVALRNLHVPLPESLYKHLKSEAEHEKKPATVLARQAIEGWLRQRQRFRTHRAVRDYASQCAGTNADLDTALESVSLEHLADEDL